MWDVAVALLEHPLGILGLLRVYDAVVRVLTALFLEVTMKVNPLVARSLVKRWSEQQVEPVRTTENGSQNFHIVVALYSYECYHLW